MRRVLRIAIPVLVLICLIGGGVFLVQQKKKELGQTRAYGAKPRPVTVTVAEKGDLRLEKEYLAVVEPVRRADISARVTAVVEKIRVDEGDRVQAGDVLAELEAREIEERIDAASSRIEQARAELAGNRATVKALEESHKYWQAEKERALALAEKGATSRSEAEQTAQKASDIKGKLNSARKKSRAIENRIESLRKQKAELEARRGYYTLTSPFSGVVTQRMADPGDMASPAKNLFEVQKQSGWKIAFDVPQKDLPRVREGQTVAFQGKNGTRKARISLLGPALNKARMMRAEAWVERSRAADLQSGAYLPVSVTTDRLEDVVLLPASALIQGPRGKTHVFAVTEGRMSAQPVKVLGRSGDRVAVQGIEAGRRVVENTYLGWATLSSGQKVEAVR